VRVALINARADAQLNPGGDTIQIDKTRAALGELGVEALECSTDSIDSLPRCDLVHVFNLQMPESAWRIMHSVRGRGLPLVFSPIYWAEYELWYGNARQSRGLWRRVSRVAGDRIARRSYVAWQRAKQPGRSTWRLQRNLLRTADALLPNSSAEASMLQSAFWLGGASGAKTHIVPNGIDPSLYLSLPKPDEEFAARHGVRDFVLEVATVYPVKNQLALLEALFDRPEPLVFIGHPHPAYTEYASECRRRGEQRGRVVFVDQIPHERLPGVYALARVHVLPSWRETPGLASLEAAAAGCRVVTTSIGSTREYFREEAQYCDPSDIASIRRAVLTAQVAPESAGLRERVLQEFTWRRAAEATAKAYADVLSRRRAPSGRAPEGRTQGTPARSAPVAEPRSTD